MIVLTDENVNGIRQYIIDIARFLETFRWITDAYVSDFFFKDYWSQLPQSWQQSLCQIQTDDLADLLTDKQITTTSSIPPLSLLCFQACCQNFSLKRRQETNVQGAVGKLTVEDTCNGNQNVESEGGTLQPTDSSGQLHAYFRKHVKPKKQHEITNLGKVIWLLSREISCGTVVDVGSGLGHLARLLAFGHGLSVTSIEASDTHAPKATKYDREIDREIKKKMEMVGDRVILPNHVTSMIYPNMTTEQFLSILDSANNSNGLNNQREATMVSESEDNDYDLKKATLVGKQQSKCGGIIGTMPNAVDLQWCKEQFKASKENSNTQTKSETTERNNQKMECFHMYEIKRYKRHSGDNFDSEIKSKISKSDKERSNLHVNKNSTDIIVHSDIQPSMLCADESALQEQSDQFSTYPTDSLYNEHYSTLKTDKDNEHSDLTNNEENQDGKGAKESTVSECETACNSVFSIQRDMKFILTGLHACGDLTPTFLRIFVSCDAAVGLASVGCCYMKLTEKSATGTPGYPMSEFVSGLPNHQQSFIARELACHFADTYYKRLKAGSSHLKIHSYRAALEWLVNQLNTAFQRSSVQIPAKKSNTMDFENYARLGLRKLGISCDNLTSDPLEQAVAMTTRWKDVVAFYTIRLALAPVVESLVLLDRMMFLHEHGHRSALVPIFDPSLSPRNFVLLSTKQS